VNKTTDEILYDLFADLDKKNEDTNFGPPQKKIAIISTPRCGSSLFCDLLRNTQQLGDPKEWINVRYLAAYSKYFDLQNIDFQQYLAFVIKKTTSNNGCFSINFHVSQYVYLKNKGFDIFKLNFDHVYALSRKDKLSQAYSLSKARITDQWSAATKKVSAIDQSIPTSHIFKSLAHIAESEELYEKDLKSKTTAEFVYEDFINLAETTAFEQIFNDCGITENTDISSDFSKQRADGVPVELLKLKQYLDF
jgi:LPS sulfotransferase NodH